MVRWCLVQTNTHTDTSENNANFSALRVVFNLKPKKSLTQTDC